MLDTFRREKDDVRHTSVYKKCMNFYIYMTLTNLHFGLYSDIDARFFVRFDISLQ